MATRVTLRDIAQTCNLHYSTVSLALRNNPRIPAQTRNKVQKIAREMGYRPDPMLNALATYRHGKSPQNFTGTLAWLNCHPQVHGWRLSKRLTQYYEGAREQAEKFGYKLEEFWYYEPGLTPRRLSQILHSRNITGILVTALTGFTGKVELDWERFAGVLVGHGLQEPQLDCVSINQMRTCSKAIAQMASLGHRRIALVTSREHDQIVENQYSNAYFCATKMGDLQEPLPILYAEEGQEDKIADYLRKERPDGLIIMPYYNISAILAKAGYGAGELGVCVLVAVGSPGERNFHRMIGPGKEVGAAAITLLDGLLRNNQCGIPEHPSRLLLEGKWVRGDFY